MLPRNELISILENLKQSFQSENIVQLRILSNESIEKASLQHDKALIEISLIAYVLSKLLTKEHVVESAPWRKIQETIEKNIDTCLEALKENNFQRFFNLFDNLTNHIDLVDKELGHYATSMMDKARLKQASRAYAFGLSLKQAAYLTQAPERELLKYIGSTRLVDEQKNEKSLSERLKEFKKALAS